MFYKSLSVGELIMLKRFIFICLLSLSVLSPALTREKSIPKKVIGGLLQIVHRHAYLLTLPLVFVYYDKLDRVHNQPDPTAATLALSTIGWLMTAPLCKTISLVALNIAEIPPLPE